MATLQGARYVTSGSLSWVNLPEPSEATETEERVWSANAGRNSSTGQMSGDVKARKRTLEIKWEFLTAAEAEVIHTWTDGATDGYVTAMVKYVSNGVTIQWRGYRGTVTKELMPPLPYPSGGASKQIKYKSYQLTFIEW